MTNNRLYYPYHGKKNAVRRNKINNYFKLTILNRTKSWTKHATAEEQKWTWLQTGNWLN